MALSADASKLVILRASRVIFGTNLLLVEYVSGIAGGAAVISEIDGAVGYELRREAITLDV